LTYTNTVEGEPWSLVRWDGFVEILDYFINGDSSVGGGFVYFADHPQCFSILRTALNDR